MFSIFLAHGGGGGNECDHSTHLQMWDERKNVDKIGMKFLILMQKQKKSNKRLTPRQRRRSGVSYQLR